MGRLLGWTFATILLVGLSTTARAQDDLLYNGWTGDPFYGGSSYGAPAYGGFGLGYMQAPVAGTVMMDRFGMFYATPLVTSAPQGVVSQPQAPTARTRSRKAPPAPRYALPTGSLYWPGASGVILYSPALRQQNYGGGYARSPYGSIEYGGWWKGWPGY
jgi:hypothetical protein